MSELRGRIPRCRWLPQPRLEKEFHGIMADFKTHITASTLLGIGYGAAGYYYLNIPPAHAMIGASMCSVAGMLPDLDSNSGIPQREMLSFVSVVVPMLMLQRFQAMHMTPEQMVFAAGVLYVLIRFWDRIIIQEIYQASRDVAQHSGCIGRGNGSVSGVPVVGTSDSNFQILGCGAGVHHPPGAR